METWFLNHVLGVSLSVLLLGLPGPLGAGTPSNNVTDPVTAGFYSSPATDELSSIEKQCNFNFFLQREFYPHHRGTSCSHTPRRHTPLLLEASDAVQHRHLSSERCCSSPGLLETGQITGCQTAQPQ
ncbi:hypothetical protein KUCAC02_010294 [Chaenocephalus aceratus]|uniref:Uncharacterized protein n=1 Tax=Chaenocephalus aceratus TaxID=36190 RepID=A0ACB9W087_CHAAC|nr:hypothetical protein KUCAC02_010294 [Chaenocephalus aceratus]